MIRRGGPLCLRNSGADHRTRTVQVGKPAPHDAAAPHVQAWKPAPQEGPCGSEVFATPPHPGPLPKLPKGEGVNAGGHMGRRTRTLRQFLHLQIPELDPIAFSLASQPALFHAAVFEFAGDCAVDPEGEGFAFGRDFEGVPLTRGFHPLVGDLPGEVEGFFLAVGAEGLAEEVAVLGVAELGLMPDRAVLGIADVRAAVVALLAFDPGVTALEVEDVIAKLFVEHENVVTAVAV